MDTSQLLKGVLDLAVLAVLRDADGYGYDVLRRLRAAGLEDVADASVYGTLRRLFAAGALTSYVQPSEEGPHRKYYGLNKTGRELLAAVHQDLEPLRRHHVGAAAGEGGRVNSTLTGAVAIYLAQVRAELSDLPPGELEDVLDDVSGHLTEVAAEFEGEPTIAALQERLGTPQQYADELRTAAGYPPRTQPVGDAHLDAGRKALRWGLIAATVGPFFIAVGIFAWQQDATAFFGLLGLAVLFGAAFLGVRALHGNDPRIVLDTPRGARGAAAIRGWIDQIPPHVRRELVSIGQPVWWVARGVIGAGGFFALFGANSVTVVGSIAGAAVSIWIGRKTQQDRRWLWYVVPLNVVAAIAVPAFLAAAYAGTSFGVFCQLQRLPRRLVVVQPAVERSHAGREPGHRTSTRSMPRASRSTSGCTTRTATRSACALQDCATNYGPATGTRPATSSRRPWSARTRTATSDPENCKDTSKAPFVPPPAPATRTDPDPDREAQRWTDPEAVDPAPRRDADGAAQPLGRERLGETDSTGRRGFGGERVAGLLVQLDVAVAVFAGEQRSGRDCRAAPGPRRRPASGGPGRCDAGPGQPSAGRSPSCPRRAARAPSRRDARRIARTRWTRCADRPRPRPPTPPGRADRAVSWRSPRRPSSTAAAPTARPRPRAQPARSRREAPISMSSRYNGRRTSATRPS